jgi:hypothetical protein
LPVTGLLLVHNFCRDKAIFERVMRECFSGGEVYLIGVSEAFAGSGLAAIRTTAVKTPGGKCCRQRDQEMGHEWHAGRLLYDYRQDFRGAPRAIGRARRGVETEKIKTSFSSLGSMTFIL